MIFSRTKTSLSQTAETLSCYSRKRLTAAAEEEETLTQTTEHRADSSCSHQTQHINMNILTHLIRLYTFICITDQKV